MASTGFPEPSSICHGVTAASVVTVQKPLSSRPTTGQAPKQAFSLRRHLSAREYPFPRRVSGDSHPHRPQCRSAALPPPRGLQATVTSVPSQNVRRTPSSVSASDRTSDCDTAPASVFSETRPAFRSSIFCNSSAEGGGGGEQVCLHPGPKPPDSLLQPPRSSAQEQITNNFFIIPCFLVNGSICSVRKGQTSRRIPRRQKQA